MIVHPPRHIVWSTDTLNLSDPFQKQWLLRQTLIYGRAEDIANLEIEDIKNQLEHLDLPSNVKSLWKHYFEYTNNEMEGK